jgi:hypothetical protein
MKHSSLVICFLLTTIQLSVNLQAYGQESVVVNAYRFGEGIRLSDKNGNEMRMSGFLQPFTEGRNRKNDLDEPTELRFRMRRLRLRLEGNTADDKFSYRFQADLSGTGEELDGSSNFLLDAWVAYNLARRVKIAFGQRATFTDNRELFMNSYSLQLVERSRLTSAFATIREVGIFMDGTFNIGGRNYLKPYFVLTNGDGPTLKTPDVGGLKIGGRLDYLPFGLFNNFGQFNQMDIMRERTPKLVIGGNYSYNSGMSSRNGRESGTILYLDNSDKVLLPNYTKFGIDFLFKYKGFSMLGEFVQATASVPGGITQRVRTDGSVTTDFSVDGVQNKENYIKARMFLGKAFNIQAGYLFKNGISVDGRYTYLDGDTHSFLNNGTFYNRPYYHTIGVSKLLGRNYGAKIQADFTYVRNNGNINNREGLPVTGNERIVRMIATFTF